MGNPINMTIDITLINPKPQNSLSFWVWCYVSTRKTIYSKRQNIAIKKNDEKARRLNLKKKNKYEPAQSE